MKRSIFLTLLLLVRFSGFSQTIEQLESALANAQTDTARSSLSSQLVEVCAAKHRTGKAQFHADKALSYAILSKNDLYVARAYFAMGRLCRLNHANELAVANYKKAFFFFRKISNSREVLNVQLEIARCWSALSKPNLSMSILEEVLPQYMILKDSSHTGACLVVQAENFIKQRLLKQAEEKYNLALRYFDAKKNMNELLSVKRQLADIFRVKGKYSQSLDTYLLCLQMAEVLQDKNQKGNILYDIAVLYTELEENFKAIRYLQEAEKMKAAVNDYYYLSLIFNAMGEIYLQKKDYSKALLFYKVSIEKASDANAAESSTNAYFKIAKIYLGLNQKEYVSQYLQKALALAIRTDDQQTEMNIYILNGELYQKMGNKDLAITFYRKAYAIASLRAFPDQAKKTAEKLSELYHLSDMQNQAYNYLRIANSLSDSVSSMAFRKKMMRMQTLYEFERRARSRKFEQEKKEDELMTNFKLQKQQKEYALVAFAFLFIVLIVVYRAYIAKKRGHKVLAESNYEIELQRDVIATKNRRITDSIFYAQRIQKAALTPVEQLDSIFEGRYFLLFKPKDIVSGDFYLAHRKGKLTFLAVADCTGHGVPGAFMSMMGIGLLNEILSRPDVLDPATALTLLRDKVIEALHQKTGIGGFKDGMNISICTIDNETLEMRFSGSYHPLYIVRGTELVEFRGDRIPISIYTKTKEAFQYYTYQMQAGDMLYMYTDGYVDQIGGDQNKKYYPKQLKKLLTDHAMLSLEEQRMVLDSTIENWRGNEDQIDDILVFGVRV